MCAGALAALTATPRAVTAWAEANVDEIAILDPNLPRVLVSLTDALGRVLAIGHGTFSTPASKGQIMMDELALVALETGVAARFNVEAPGFNMSMECEAYDDTQNQKDCFTMNSVNILTSDQILILNTLIGIPGG